MANHDGKTDTVATLDEKAYGADARASRKEMFVKGQHGDILGAEGAAAKTAYEVLKHQLSHPVDATIGQIELIKTPTEERKRYLENEKSR